MEESNNILDNFPHVDSFFGVVDLRTGSFIIATLGIVHPIAYGCTCLLPRSYAMVTIWMLSAVYCVVNVGLFCGLTENNAHFCRIWIWWTIIITTALDILMVLLLLAYVSRQQYKRAVLAFLGLIWYVLTVYFILVVNAHRKQLSKNVFEPTTTLKPTRTTSEGPSRKMLRVYAEDSDETPTIVGVDLNIDKGSINVLENFRRGLIEETKVEISTSTRAQEPDNDFDDALVGIKTTVSKTQQSTSALSTESISRSSDSYEYT